MPPTADARRLLDEMLVLAESRRDLPDAKARSRALLDFIACHRCPAVAFGGAQRTGGLKRIGNRPAGGPSSAIPTATSNASAPPSKAPTSDGRSQA